jgi:hypothetical protein
MKEKKCRKRSIISFTGGASGDRKLQYINERQITIKDNAQLKDMHKLKNGFVPVIANGPSYSLLKKSQDCSLLEIASPKRSVVLSSQ